MKLNIVVASIFLFLVGCGGPEVTSDEGSGGAPISATRATGQWQGQFANGQELVLDIKDDGTVTWNGQTAFADPAGDETLSVTLSNGQNATFFYRLDGENLILDVNGEEVMLTKP